MLNLGPFMAVWKQVLYDGEYLHHDWILKARFTCCSWWISLQIQGVSELRRPKTPLFSPVSACEVDPDTVLLVDRLRPILKKHGEHMGERFGRILSI